ncbi:AI-2E family transporter [Candidatus Nomurabacteria bacterium]|nr:AI-2E family transporter [Candidatus Nomurabacteria bacterium]
MSEENTKHVKVSISTGTIMRILVIGGLLFVAIKLINIILIVLTSIVIASFIERAVGKMKKYIKNRVLAVFIVYVVVFALLIGLASVFIPVFVNEMSALVSSLKQYIPDGSILNTFQPDAISGAKGVVNTISSHGTIGDLITSTQNLANSLSSGLFDVFSQVFGSLLNLILIIIISFYLSIKEKGIENFLRVIIPDESEEYIINLWQRTEHKIGLWMQGQMLIGLIIGVLTYLGLTIIGVKYSLVLSIITGVLEVIPFGIYLAVVPAAMFSYLDGGATLSLLTIALYFVIHQFEAYLIYPLIIKKVIGISPLVIILSILIGLELAGFWGVILAVPFAVCLFEFLDDLEKKKILARDS